MSEEPDVLTVLGIDDTDSRTEGMCTTYVGHRIKRHLERIGHECPRICLIRLNPAVEHKTRGNAAVAIHTTAPPSLALRVAEERLQMYSKTNDPNTNPSAVAAPKSSISEDAVNYSQSAVREIISLSEATQLAETNGWLVSPQQEQRGRIGACAAIGAYRAFSDWTFEEISYRFSKRWGSERHVCSESIRNAANRSYPDVWDTFDHRTETAVCVPRTPCPILYGIRGDVESEVKSVSASIEGEPVASREVFLTNQGTDLHLREVEYLARVQNNQAYKVQGTVCREPTNNPGGHVVFTISDVSDTLDCIAFEPTKQFRDYVRSLRKQDVITVCGEISDSTLKLEKLKVEELKTEQLQNPTCSNCSRNMKSAGANQGYRCTKCDTEADSQVSTPLDRTLECGWYEVPPIARRHIAKPLIRGGFEGTTHPQR